MPDFFILASGQSMTQEQADAVRGLGTVITINRTYELAPWCDILYGCDAKFWQYYPDALDCPARKVSIEYRDPRVQLWAERKEPGLGLAPGVLHSGQNSGYQAINLAYHLGATRIILLGYDMHGDHWHPQHKPPLSCIQKFDDWIPRFDQLARDLKKQNVSVLNCTPGTKLKAFRRKTLNQFLGSRK
jgi:hypothetical protein